MHTQLAFQHGLAPSRTGKTARSLGARSSSSSSSSSRKACRLSRTRRTHSRLCGAMLRLAARTTAGDSVWTSSPPCTPRSWAASEWWCDARQPCRVLCCAVLGTSCTCAAHVRLLAHVTRRLYCGPHALLALGPRARGVSRAWLLLRQSAPDALGRPFNVLTPLCTCLKHIVQRMLLHLYLCVAHLSSCGQGGRSLC